MLEGAPVIGAPPRECINGRATGATAAPGSRSRATERRAAAVPGGAAAGHHQGAAHPQRHRWGRVITISRDTGPLTCRQRQLRQQRVPGQPQGQVRGVPQVPGALPLLQQHQETQQTLRGHQPLWHTLDLRPTLYLSLWMYLLNKNVKKCI